MQRKILAGFAVLTVVTLTGSTGSATTPIFVNPPSLVSASTDGVKAATQDSVGAQQAPPVAKKQTPVNSISYLVGRYGITPEEAQRRLQLQVDSAALAAQLAEQHPAEYAGMWLDQAGGGVLRVAMTRPELVPALAGVAPVAASRSLKALEQEARDLAAADPSAEVYVDQPSNQVIVRRGASTFVAKCDPRHCGAPPIRGGIRLDIPRDNGTVGGCSVGYRVRSAVTGKQYLLTAGHCVNSPTHTHVDQTWHEYLGPRTPVTVEDADTLLTENVPGTSNDYAIMPYQNSAAEAFWLGQPTDGRRGTPLPHLVNYHDLKVTGFTALAQIQVGWVVCASGSGYTPEPGESYVDSGAGRGYLPGTHCGEITGKDSAIYVKICARKGDSGGPLFTEADGKALGILSGGDDRSGPCVAGDTETNRYAAISSILTRVNSRTSNAYQFELMPQPTPTPTIPRRG